jgi:C1A family cysteine protease
VKEFHSANENDENEFTQKVFDPRSFPNPTQIKEAVNQQPVSAYMNISPIKTKRQAFFQYKRGIYDPPHEDCWGWPNHTILIVGYGFDIESSKEYWIILNSWGSGWGENGYAKIAFGTEKEGGCGTCGMLCDYVSWPILET